VNEGKLWEGTVLLKVGGGDKRQKKHRFVEGGKWAHGLINFVAGVLSFREEKNMGNRVASHRKIQVKEKPPGKKGERKTLSKKIQ